VVHAEVDGTGRMRWTMQGGFDAEVFLGELEATSTTLCHGTHTRAHVEGQRRLKPRRNIKIISNFN